MSQFSLLWGKILRSSLWVQESKETRLVWITMLALKDKDGVVESSLVGLADSAKVSVEECRRAVGVLLAADPNDTSKVEEGRRIREVAGGWQIVNHELYRYSSEHQRAYWAGQKAEQRARKAVGGKGKVRKKSERGKNHEAAARRFEKAVEAGDEGRADAIAAGEE